MEEQRVIEKTIRLEHYYQGKAIQSNLHSCSVGHVSVLLYQKLLPRIGVV